MRWFALLSLTLLPISSYAQEKEDAELIGKQKKTVEANLQKCDVPKPVTIETANLIISGPLPEDKVKSAGEAIQKNYAAIFKLLKFENLENPPKGKVAVYLFPERKNYGFFVEQVVGDRPEKDERAHFDSRGQEPYLAVSVLPGEKPTDLDVESTRQIAALLLQAKAGGARLPTWMTEGYVRAVRWRTDPKTAGEKTTLRRLAAKYKAADLWMPPIDKEKMQVGALMMEYFAFGPESAKFGKFLNGFRQNEGDPAPNMMMALIGIDMTPEKLEAAWVKWVRTGK